ncbi:Formin, GTPase-binding domain-containing protein [Fennellomyces sp. T-0311]|nr:Formin, GTPase-binding domain-containing protein [Fennellomyces sp. T-0311]
MSSSDSVNELLATHPDMLTDSQVEARFEKMLTRRGINDPNARAVMLDFPIEKKRLMVSQDIQAETGAMKSSTQTVSRRGVAADTSEKKSPEFYVKKLSEPDMKGIHAKTLAHLSVSLRTMPLSWVRQFIDMRGMQIITAALGVINKSKHKREVDLQAEGEILRCFKALLNNTVKKKCVEVRDFDSVQLTGGY